MRPSTRSSKTRRRALCTAAVMIAALAVPLMSGTASAQADREVRLVLDPSDADCTVFNPLDCSYFMARNGNAPAPDPEDPEAAEPTFINMALLPEAPTVDATIARDGSFTVAEGDANFPSVTTVVENPLIGEVSTTVSFVQTGAWDGTFDLRTGALDVDAPLTLSFTLSCDPSIPGLCAPIFGADGDMGTWQVDADGPVSMTTGHMESTPPPEVYGEDDWVPPVVEDGSPYDMLTQGITLINNNLEFDEVGAANCQVDDPASLACNPLVAPLISAEINNAIGAGPDGTAPGAIDMRMEFALNTCASGVGEGVGNAPCEGVLQLEGPDTRAPR
jgi:hypothetical protein